MRAEVRIEAGKQEDDAATTGTRAEGRAGDDRGRATEDDATTTGTRAEGRAGEDKWRG